MKAITLLIVLVALSVAVICDRMYPTIMNEDTPPSIQDLFRRKMVKRTAPRIYGGQNASPTDAPFQTFLFIQSSSQISSGEGSFCGGALINSEWVLTAAHCFGDDYQNGLRILVYYGGVNPRDSSSGMRQYASAFIINSAYTTDGFQNDIGLIKLRTPVQESSDRTIQYVNIATSLPSVGTQLQIQGYGETYLGQNFSSTPIVLNVGTVSLASDQTCTDYFNEVTNPPSGEHFPPNFFHGATDICVQEGSVSTCHGDSGGSAVYKSASDERWTSVGLVSYGANICPGTYTAYTQVPAYASWIQGNIASSSSMSTLKDPPVSSTPTPSANETTNAPASPDSAKISIHAAPHTDISFSDSSMISVNFVVLLLAIMFVMM